MARPLSEEKRGALLAAATDAVAFSGAAASAVKIAHDAGVAERTLFIYFPTKDDLLNRLYLDLNSDLTRFSAAEYPAGAGIQRQVHHIWNRLIIGGEEPGKEKGVTTAGCLREDYSGQSECTGEDIPRPRVHDREWVRGRHPDAALEKVSRDPANFDQCKCLGWKALWGAIARR